MASVIHAVGHGLSAGDPFRFANLVPSNAGPDETVTYYVLAAGLGADDFEFSDTPGGTAFDLTYPITDGALVTPDSYVVVTDGVMDPPVTPVVPANPTLSSALVSGIVRLIATLAISDEAYVRAYELQITHQFGGVDPDFVPDWAYSVTYTLPAGATELSIPALGSTVYAVRIRKQDVYGNFSSWSDELTHTTLAGNDGLYAALADIANDVPDGIITETKIADDSITTPKIRANAITADLLAATIVLTSLLKTADTGRRIELDEAGLRLYDSSDVLLANLPTNGDPIYIKGQVNADSLISQTAASFRTAASLEANSTMTLQSGVSAPANPPAAAASVENLALTSTPPDLGYGIWYDSAGGAGGATPSYWVGADPTASGGYVAHEYNASTGALMRSITKTGSITTFTDTIGATSHVSDIFSYTPTSTWSQVCSPLTMPRDGRVTRVRAYFAAYSGDTTCKVAVWSNSSNTMLASSSSFTLPSRSLALGNSTSHDRALTAELELTAGTIFRAGFLKINASEGLQFDEDTGSGKKETRGDGLDGNLVSPDDSTVQKINVSVTYEYDVDSTLEGYTGKIIGVARAGNYVYVLEDTGIIYSYLQSDLTFVAKTDVSVRVTGTKAKAGLFYDATAALLIITTTVGTGAGTKTRFATFTVASGVPTFSANLDDTTLSVSGTTDTFRGGVRVTDALNSNTAEYWVPISGTVYAFVASTGANVTNRDFGTSATVADGLAHDGTVFRGWATASPTKVWKFTAWDWTTASAVYWFCYAWYDDAGTTHETAVGPRTSLTLRRHERVQVINADIPVGGADDPDKVRIYIKPNATDPGAGNFKLQVTDALTARYLTDYNSSGAADGGGTAFPAGTPAILQSSTTGWKLTGDGLAKFNKLILDVTNADAYIRRSAAKTLTLDTDGAGTTLTAVDFLGALLRGFSGTSFPASPTTGDRFYRTDHQMWFAYDGTRWLCTCLHTLQSGSEIANKSATTADVARIAPMPDWGSDLWIESFGVGYQVTSGTALSGSHKWVIDVKHVTVTTGAQTIFATKTINSGSSGVWRRDADATIDALLGAQRVFFLVDITKTGTPGNLYAYWTLTYRIVAT